MLKRKNWLAGLLALVMLFSLTACGEKPAETAPPTDEGQTDAPPAESQLTEWEQFANIYATDETDEELYEKAKEEGGEMTFYSVSSRCAKVAEAFMEKYPGIKVTAVDISVNELLEKVTREHDAGIHTADMIHVKDQDGSLYREYVQAGKFYCYKPADILSHIDPKYTETSTPLYIEMTQFFYNAETYPDGSPITNIWQVTEPQWKGKILMQNPLDNITWGSWITGFCVGEGPEQLAASYKELYGEELVLSEGCENAGYEFLKRLHDNQPTYTSSSDEVVTNIGTMGQKDPPIGFAASSKMRKALDNGLAIAAANLEPTNGIPGISNVYVVEGCLHPSAAKLMVRFMMGGIDGDTRGYDPFNTLGAWPIRDDITPPEGAIPFSEMNVLPFESDLMYENYNTVRDFWQLLG